MPRARSLRRPVSRTFAALCDGLTATTGGTSRRRRSPISLPASGLAYKITDKVVVRSGYGLFYVPRNIQGNGLGAITAFRDTPMVTSLDNNITPLNRLSNPFPQGVLPPLNDRDPGANIGAQIQAPFYENKSGYTQLWSLAVQWEMPGQRGDAGHVLG